VGTDVTVVATLGEGGSDRGGSSWVRVVPGWFGPWCLRRDFAARPQPELARLAVGLYYEKPAVAAKWLASVFGLESPNPLPDRPDAVAGGENEQSWIEFRIGNCSLMVFERDDLDETGPSTHEVWGFVDELGAHLLRARAGGAKILRGIHQNGYRAYEAEDLEGHRWVFAQARPRQS
jgi:uncharacterized glyoxalase superfamily protein PhnB